MNPDRFVFAVTLACMAALFIVSDVFFLPICIGYFAFIGGLFIGERVER